MEVIVTGFLTYDRIFQIDGLLSNLSDRDQHTLMKVSFHAREIVERFGGNAGNVALLLKKPVRAREVSISLIGEQKNTRVEGMTGSKDMPITNDTLTIKGERSYHKEVRSARAYALESSCCTGTSTSDFPFIVGLVTGYFCYLITTTEK